MAISFAGGRSVNLNRKLSKNAHTNYYNRRTTERCILDFKAQHKNDKNEY